MKFVMAVTGIAMLGFLVGHLAGNLQVFGGYEGINAYGAFLKGSPGILWTTRIGLLIALGLHIWAGVRLSRINHAARPQAYAVKKNRASSWYARYMLVSGTIIFAFLVFHLLHFTVGSIFPKQFALLDPLGRHDVFSMMVLSFQIPWVVVFYVVAMTLLFFHLGHGIWSMTQSLGFWGPRFTPAMMKIGVAIAILLAVGFATMPIAILGGALDAQVEQGGAQP
ncbi:MAG: succinate dehydrogenase cytochrome b subunit [Myxococcaceae bacterium]